MMIKFQKGCKYSQLKNIWFQDHLFQNFTFQSNDSAQQITKIFQNQGIEVSYCKETKVNSQQRQISLSIPKRYEKFIQNLEDSKIFVQLQRINPVEVQWFPKCIEQLDLVKPEILDMGQREYEESEIFHDQDYKSRLNYINTKARNNKMGELIDHIDYTEKQEEVWKYLVIRTQKYHQDAMCEEYKQSLENIKKQLNIVERIPQLQDVSDYLKSKTGFRIKPTHGIITQRAFLNALAFKVFHSTQYIRHHSNPDFSFFPDLFHEIIGHVPMFAHPIIAKISQLIGLASLGASDEIISQLGALYLFTIEFGFILENGRPYCYGAGPAACISEMVNIRSKNANFKRLEPEKDCKNTYPIMDLQSQYYYTSSLKETLSELKKFCQASLKPFNARLSDDGKFIEYDRSIKFKINI